MPKGIRGFQKGHKINQERITRGEKVGFQKNPLITKGIHPKSEFKIGNKIMVGRKHSEETKNKIRQSRLKNPTRYWLGKHLSDGHKKKLSIQTSKRVGEKGANWKGGKSFEPYSVDWKDTLKRSIRERDKYTCQICKEPQGEEALSVHHIDYDKLNCNPNNLIALCRRCHTKTNGNRNYWINYFKI